MSRTSNVVWGLVALVVVILAALGAIYGPELVREGKALVGPIVEIARSEERLDELNAKLPFSEPTDGSVAEDRFAVFLEIRGDLLPLYIQWQDVERELEKSGQEDWESAKEVLSAIQRVMGVQLKTLETRGMSPAEFLYIEDLAYATWLGTVEDMVTLSAVDEALRESIEADSERLAELERRYGRSNATTEFSDYLDQRLRAIDNPQPPVVDGVSSVTSALFWNHRNELVDLDFAAYSGLHGILRGGNDVEIKIDGEGE